MCKDQSSSAGPSWNIERRAGAWRVKVEVSKAPEVDISPSALRLKLNSSCESVTLPIPENALPLDPDAARCSFSKRRGELVVEWPCGDSVATESEKTAESSVTAEPAVTVEPSVTAEPPVAEEPSVAAEALITEEPSVIVESLATAEPSAPEEPSVTAEPSVAADPSATAQPPAIAEPPAPHTPEPLVSAEEWRTRGNAAVKTGDLDTAIQCYSSGITAAEKNNGGDREAEALLRSNRALCLHKLARYEEAVDDAKRCVELKPEFVKGYLRGAMSLRALSCPAEALALLKRAPVNDEACALAAEIRPEAEAAEKARIEALPKAERTKEEGNVLFRKGLFEAAAEKYSEALGLCEEPAGSLALSIRNNRAACNHQISDFSAVIKDTNFVLEHEPQNCKALMRRMLALEPLERYEQALQDARGVLSQDPRNEVANKVQHRLGKLVRDLSRANGGA